MRQDTTQDATRQKSSSRTTVYEAAEALGVTVDAIRKRIQRGTLAHERDENGRVYVLLDLTSTSGDIGQDAYRTTRDELIESLRDQVEYLRGELSIRAEELRRKDHIIAALTERIPELEASQDAPEGRETASVSPVEQKPTQEDVDAQKGAQRGWWRALFGG